MSSVRRARCIAVRDSEGVLSILDLEHVVRVHVSQKVNEKTPCEMIVYFVGGSISITDVKEKLKVLDSLMVSAEDVRLCRTTQGI